MPLYVVEEAYDPERAETIISKLHEFLPKGGLEVFVSFKQDGYRGAKALIPEPRVLIGSAYATKSIKQNASVLGHETGHLVDWFQLNEETRSRYFEALTGVTPNGFDGHGRPYHKDDTGVVTHYWCGLGENIYERWQTAVREAFATHYILSHWPTSRWPNFPNAWERKRNNKRLHALVRELVA